MVRVEFLIPANMAMDEMSKPILFVLSTTITKSKLISVVFKSSDCLCPYQISSFNVTNIDLPKIGESVPQDEIQ
jgi:hypothetical protein